MKKSTTSSHIFPMYHVFAKFSALSAWGVALRERCTPIWRFPKVGVPPVIIQFCRTFHEINHPFGVPQVMETLISGQENDAFADVARWAPVSERSHTLSQQRGSCYMGATSARGETSSVKDLVWQLSSVQNLCWLMIIVDYTTQYVGGFFGDLITQ